MLRRSYVLNSTTLTCVHTVACQPVISHFFLLPPCWMLLFFATRDQFCIVDTAVCGSNHLNRCLSSLHIQQMHMYTTSNMIYTHFCGKPV